MIENSQNVETMLHQFAILRKAYGKICFRTLRKYSFSPSEIEILIFLSNNESINTAKELVFYLNISKALVARSVESLRGRGLLEVKEDLIDKRIKRLQLKNDCDGIVKSIKKEKVVFFNMITNNVTNSELIKLVEVMETINLNIENIMEGSYENNGEQ